MKNPKTKRHLLFPVFLLSFFLLSQLALIQFLSPAPAEAATSKIWQMQTGVNEVGAQAFGDSTPKDIRIIVAKVLKAFLGFMGIIFLVLLISAGFKYMTAAGNEEKTREAIDQIKTAIIGLIIIVAAYAITEYITNCVLNITGESSTWMCQKEPTY